MSAAASPLSVTEIFSGRKLLLLGGTGFVGKVAMSMLLHNFPNIGRLYVMVRAGSGTSSEERFWADVVASPTFDPLRDRYGAALEGFLRDKVRVVGGDITEPYLGFDEQQARAIADDIDVIINSSGKVTFNPALDQSLRTNVKGMQNVLAFTKLMKRPALVHVSTCFVAGNRNGEVWEDEELLGYFPRRDGMPGTEFSVEQEIADCQKLAVRAREEADDAVLKAELLQAARSRLIDEGRNPDNERYLRLAQARERKNWIRSRLTALGVDRAQRWGWPNIYCYTKALGDQLVARETSIVRTIVRPAIVESARQYPFPGWNEGFTTTAPLCFLALKGQTAFVASDRLILDLVPVDDIAGAIISVAAQACVEQPKLVHQLASGDTNPFRMRRVVTLLGLYKRKYYQERQDGNRWVNELLARMEAHTADGKTFDRTSLPMFNRVARQASELLGRVRPRWGTPRLDRVIDRVQQEVDNFERRTSEIGEAFEAYRPFTVSNHYIFRTDHTRALQQRFVPAERHLVPWGVADIDWYAYWLDVHCPGLRRWVFPGLEKEYASRPRSVFTYNHLLELFETTAKLHSKRIALSMQRDGVNDRYTYEELEELAVRAAGFLSAQGVGLGDRVMLLSENRPEWPMSYFGVIKCGATCVPVDKELSVAEILNLAQTGEVRGLIISRQQWQDRPDLNAELAAKNIPLWPLSDVLALEQTSADTATSGVKPQPSPRVKSDAVASLLFTSGTTGRPKGVMLTQRNLTAMVSELSSVFDVGPSDRLISVLPLHHTFEFSAGLLLPLAHGAQIHYLAELTGEAIGDALQTQRPTAIVGVPALWELLQRRIRSRIDEHALSFLPSLFDGLVASNRWIRQHTPLNFGALLFWPLHRRFGGRIRYLISGGSALAAGAKRFFYALGLPLLEGYGLTEASPVITVSRPDLHQLSESVGQPLPHVEVKILDPDPRGVGEVLARGNTIMAGYYNDQKSTDEALQDNWLHTGDLGYLDDKKNLYLVGRRKHVIVDSNGKNVYPDEIEELYADCALIKEMSVVGLPDGTAERVAALVVPDDEYRSDLDGAEVRRQIHEHFRRVSATLPFFRRIKVLHLTDTELPRTSTRKIKRSEVVAELLQLQQQQGATDDMQKASQAREAEWLIDTVARVSGKPRHNITLDTRLAELGFDSLMYTELGVAIEAAGATLRSVQDLTGIADIRELVNLVQPGRSALVEQPRKETRPADSDEWAVPQAMAEVGTRALERSQRWLYRQFFDADFRGQDRIPYHTNFIVAPNHCSHLDAGLVKVALKQAGHDLCALAASDYFFDSKIKRAYFDNFTNLVPMDRSGSLRKSLRQAQNLLLQRNSLLIFPEGTRSVTGEISEFKASLGYLALQSKVGILPMYLSGTHKALPKGGRVVRSRSIGAHIGPFIEYRDLLRLTQDMTRAESYRLVAWVTQTLVEAMRDGQPCQLEIDRWRENWLSRHRAEEKPLVQRATARP